MVSQKKYFSNFKQKQINYAKILRAAKFKIFNENNMKMRE